MADDTGPDGGTSEDPTRDPSYGAPATGGHEAPGLAESASHDERLRTLARTRGLLLATWLEYGGERPHTQAAAAAAGGRSKQGVSDLITGKRGVSAQRGNARLGFIEAVAQLVDASNQALPLLWQALATSVGLPPRSDWQFNLPVAGDACWVWLRSPNGCVADLTWGMAVRGHVRVPAGRSAGVLVAIPTSVPNPPLEVEFDGPGWADAGHGTMPAAVARALDVQIVTGRQVQVHGRGRADKAAWTRIPAAEQFVRWVDDHLDANLELALPYASQLLIPDDRPARTAAGGDLVPPVTAGRPQTDAAGLVRQVLLAPTDIKLLREARGYTVQSVTDAMNALEVPRTPGQAGAAEVSRELVRRLEASGTAPRRPLAVARLDRALAAGGHLGLERTYTSSTAEPLSNRAFKNRVLSAAAQRSDVIQGWLSWLEDDDRDALVHEVLFPSWWVGPVWLETRHKGSRARTAHMRLRWGPWRRTEVVGSGGSYTTRKAPEPAGKNEALRVRLPNSWQLVAGTGLPPAAVDIGRGWTPATPLAGVRVLLESGNAIRARAEIARPGQQADGPAQAR